MHAGLPTKNSSKRCARTKKKSRRKMNELAVSIRRRRWRRGSSRCARRGSQPGGGKHPPNLRGWLPGEVQAILQIHLWSKNTRTHQELEWFGPSERNTLRPLRVVSLLGLRMSLSSALRSPFRPESPPNGRLPFIEQGGCVHKRWSPTSGPNKDVYYTK